MARYISADGLMSSSTPEGAALWDEICARQNNAAAAATEYLRSIGVKLAHPDDGWVSTLDKHGNYQSGIPRADRGDGYLSVSWYPLFDDHPQEGDLIALGQHYDLKYGDSYRICRVTKTERNYRLIRWEHLYFVDTGERWPEQPKKPWWKRLLTRGRA